jgi:hypothetical protein
VKRQQKSKASNLLEKTILPLAVSDARTRPTTNARRTDVDALTRAIREIAKSVWTSLGQLIVLECAQVLFQLRLATP